MDRYYIHDSLDYDREGGLPYGDNTVGIVDEQDGSIILYCHEGNAMRILNALRGR